MKYAEYVIGGWIITGAAVLTYWVRLTQKIRRAERFDPDA
jgi:hypothetical protein